MTGNTHRGTLDCYAPTVLLERLAVSPDVPVQTLDGTAVLVDISGFTSLSERLARTGREGAEQLTEAIDACFSALLADADGYGGVLLKFGGDALLSWFGGHEHALRACAAAAGMRRSMRHIGEIQTRAGRVVLRMSVGVHSGTFETFLVGGSHREYVVAGSAVDAVIAMEASASAGEILVSADTAALLPGGCLGQRRSPGTLLSRMPVVQYGAPPDARVRASHNAVAECLSPVLRAHLLAAPVVPEHRTATVAFVQFGGLNELIDERGPDAAAQALDEFVRVVQDAAARYDVCLLGSDVAAGGGKLILTGGAPRTVGDDEARMLLAVRQIVEARPTLPPRVGVNCGHVFAGEIGPARRRTYTVMGDAVNLAARLMAEASWGAIYATSGVLQRSQSRFETTPIAPFQVKGKRCAVDACGVGRALRAAPPAAAHGRLPLIGRERELAVLREAIARAEAGRGELVEIVGETGSGKSRLLAEARELASGMLFVHGSCDVYTQTVPYIGWRDPLRQLLGLSWEDGDDVVVDRLRSEVEGSGSDLVRWLPLLAIAVGAQAPGKREVAELSSDIRASKLHEAVIRFLSPALAIPTLVQIENADFMDDASAELLAALAIVLDSSRWVVIVTRRDAERSLTMPRGTGVSLRLGALSPQNAVALAESSPEAYGLPPHVLALAAERSAGNPGFLLDLLAVAAGGSSSLPASIDSAANARIDALDPGDRMLVRRAAVLGLRFDPSRLRDVLDVGATAPDETTWMRLSGIFAHDLDGRVRFLMAALREAAYHGLPFRLRRELHRSVANVLERLPDHDVDADPAVLSLHCMLAGDSHRAWKYAMLGAQRAAARFAHADAARLYRRAVEAGRADAAEPGALANAWEGLGDELRQAGEPVKAARALTTARLLTDDPNAAARLFYKQACVAHYGGDLRAAVRWINRGLRGLEDVPGREANGWHAQLTSLLASTRILQGRYRDAERLSRRVIADAAAVGEQLALARAYYVLDWALVELGRPEQAAYSAKALEIYEQLGDLEHEAGVLNNLGMFAYHAGRWDEASEWYRRSARCSERAGIPADVALVEANIGEILSDQGKLSAAAEYLQRAHRVLTSTKDARSAAFVTLQLGRLAARSHRADEATRLLEQAMHELEALGDANAGLAAAALAEADALAGDPSQALARVQTLRPHGDRYLPLLLRTEGIALVRLGHQPVAESKLHDAETVARQRNADYELAATLDALEVLRGLDTDRVIERDAILQRLGIERLPRIRLKPQSSGETQTHAA